MGDVDELFEVRSLFYSGNYQGAINAGVAVPAGDEALRIARDVFVYRSYCALGNYPMVLNEIADDAPTDLRAVKLLASYLSSPDNHEMALVTLQDWLGDGAAGNNATLQVVSGIIYANEGNFEEALRSLFPRSSLEAVALNVQIYLAMHRRDLAEKELKTMSTMDDDATLTQLATAWVNLALGGAKVKDGYYIYQELIDKFSATTTLLNGLATCQMAQGNFDEANAALRQALEKNPNDAQTLANLVACEQHQKKPQEQVNVFLRQLRTSNANHAIVQSMQTLEQSFDRNAERFAV